MKHQKARKLPKPKERKCDECKRTYTYFRSSSRFCDYKCRSKFQRARTSDRNALLTRVGHRCEECGPGEIVRSTRLFVRADPRYGGIKRVLCGQHTNALTVWIGLQRPLTENEKQTKKFWNRRRRRFF